MAKGKTGFQGWVIVGCAALAIGLMCAAILAIYGVNDESVSLVIRATARTSFALFLSAFAASALFKLWPGARTRWLRANRRYLGVSFAVSHGFHAMAITGLAWLTSGRSMDSLDAFSVTGGLLAYGFIAAMAATSFDRTAAWLGPRRWRILHTAGMYYIWANFMFAYGGRAVFSIAYAPLAALLVLALALRIIKSRKPKQLAAAKGA